jgi:hypothetical protein
MDRRADGLESRLTPVRLRSPSARPAVHPTNCEQVAVPLRKDEEVQGIPVFVGVANTSEDKRTTVERSVWWAIARLATSRILVCLKGGDAHVERQFARIGWEVLCPTDRWR